MIRMPRVGRPIAAATLLLWSYIGIATYLVKLIPLYGGYDKGRNTLRETLNWYISNGRDLTSVLSIISLAPPAAIYLETAAITGFAAAFAAGLALGVWSSAGTLAATPAPCKTSSSSGNPA
jgi:hypothetical protein